MFVGIARPLCSNNTGGNGIDVAGFPHSPGLHKQVTADDQAAKSSVAGVASAVRSTPSFRGIVHASGPQYHQRVGSEKAGHDYDHRLQHRWWFGFNASLWISPLEISCNVNL